MVSKKRKATTAQNTQTMRTKPLGFISKAYKKRVHKAKSSTIQFLKEIIKAISYFWKLTKMELPVVNVVLKFVTGSQLGIPSCF
ncbi:hypothetical protein [Sunxiuqinia elliptica]|uniref:Uncharacterized protein n=1 Tax=Sunxiuqinia elliptica TaxID=655355 RepID=A0A4R6H854_9BACT|nr:hypothetical protein [Sunxiuqinia elliptica]TDO03766.1 hypothetical protein DET52_10298 [Sunxiuqinia elliptica]TDO62047.1 hypothetical protein DET65_1774 [Sunxiuqinia elliptica]